MYKITPNDKDVERPRIAYMEKRERGLMKDGKLHKERTEERKKYMFVLLSVQRLSEVWYELHLEWVENLKLCRFIP